MKKITYLFLILLGLISCNGRDYRYKIEGLVKVGTEFKPAIAYTDTIYGQNEDSIWYYNTNGTKLTIVSPYTVSKIK